jgi:hypothetical protein
MKNQALFLAAVSAGITIGIGSAATAAGRPFGRFSTRSSRPVSNQSSVNRANSVMQSRHQNAVPSNRYVTKLLNSPERLEQVYGPSILIRKGMNATSGNVAAKQPE